MKPLKFLILLFYYDRPEMVKNALNSIKRTSYKDYHIAFIDDGSSTPGKPIVEELLDSEELSKVTFYNTNQSPSDKKTQGGSIFGKYANIATDKNPSDITLMLCDDDALTPGYLEYLNEFFHLNSEVNHCYSKVLFYDPSKEDYLESREHTPYTHVGSTFLNLNIYTTPVNPIGKFDASQVAWRTKCNIEFPFPRTRALDSIIYTQLGDNHGLCYPTGIFGQCKGAFEDQLGNRWKDGKDEFIINTK
jgi:glycosyltransferase involved in cell wall biosynthesis|tara:strand:- start:3 stop:743 length:741 start_codon:yes stop_codon:yes gene_type:complete